MGMDLCRGVNLLKAMELVDYKEPDITWEKGSGGEEMNTQEICISQDPEHIAQWFVVGGQ
jgi:hypothetical protein